MMAPIDVPDCAVCGFIVPDCECCSECEDGLIETGHGDESWWSACDCEAGRAVAGDYSAVLGRHAYRGWARAMGGGR
jgi:hypothetical protein